LIAPSALISIPLHATPKTSRSASHFGLLKTRGVAVTVIKMSSHKTDADRLADANQIIRGKNAIINALRAELRRVTKKEVKISYGDEVQS
jgi:hypothetical protein